MARSQSDQSGGVGAGREMRLPDFLIVGAQRCGTSTLYEDLLDTPDVFMPAVKEPYNLTEDSVLSERGLAEYARLFAPGADARRCGEASTRYTMRPHYEGCAQRARRALGPDLRVIYLIREPISRAISHYRFDCAHGWVSRDTDAELQRHARYVNAGRYAYQILPWIEAFGRERVHIERFEHFVGDRPGALGRICGFLGVDAPAAIPSGRAVNASARLRPLKGAGARIAVSPVYQRRLRVMIPRRLRALVRSAALPSPSPGPAPPRRATARYLADRLGAEVEAISRILGAAGPIWDLDAVVLGHEAGPEGERGAASGAGGIA